MPAVPPFTTLEATRPDLPSLRTQFEALSTQITEAADADTCHKAVQSWETLRRQVETWRSLTHLRFHQDTANAAFKAEREAADEMEPQLIELEILLKRALLDSPFKETLAAQLGEHVFNLWSCDITTFEPIIQEDLVLQSKLVAEYVELLAKDEVTFANKTMNLTEVAKHTTAPDRDTRHEAEHARWAFFSSHEEKLDQLFGDLVTVRHGMAQKLGYDKFTELGYKLMHRVDYAKRDVEVFRSEIRNVVVPLAMELRESQKENLGVDKLMFWDEGVHSKSGNPVPRGDAPWLIEQGKAMFKQMHPELDTFFTDLTSGEYLDLENRKTKAGGGFCTSFPTIGMPFIFTNSNNTTHDVEVLVHEAGHAFQNWNSQSQPLSDYIWPTYESAEIHSMSLEFLTWPSMDLFFGQDAEKFRRQHLITSLLFLPYGVAVDHFQHLIYETPNATANQRHEMWLEMQRTYLPWRDHGDIPHLQKGGRWQLQRHIYGMPFYYIDYTLAQTCAFQFWAMSRENSDLALERYIALCKRGGEAPFQELVKSAGLTSPFQKGCLDEVVRHIRSYLEM